MCMFIVWYPIEFSRLHNLHPWYWNSLLHGLISSGENSAHFLQLLPFTILHCWFHQVPITAGWTEAAWYERLAQHLYPWPAAWLEHRSPIQVLTGLSVAYASVPLGFFLASPMHSRWKLTSIRRCSGGITEPSANNLLVFMLKIARHREASRV